ncbi:PH domain-containing protein [Aldersonia sp. NBC_00410]|uniref:PH domain-containing protein n=1 Tax=Aldersonia sp. NBC_00410 TaxID=2975954 RepID=UPI0022584EB1|nr:PH domain-containing protein [Aldersonia sp. NBC_00410]MCX5043785.1 PH domain-containing protein [Aldersonia sp. NBC_00410]
MSRVTMVDPAWRPSHKARWLWAINAALLWLVVLVAQVVWAVADGSIARWHAVALVATLVAGAVHIGVVPAWRYAVHRWEISENAVYTRTGWFNQERRIAPISRVQTVDTERGPIDRLLGLATVTVTTASAAGAVKITALDLDVAERTVARLTAIAGGTGEDAT